jgi:DNA-binding PadR family transcriptional regulator
MTERPPETRSLWELTVLSLLRLRPMHPYELSRLIREWHKADFLDLKPGSLYHAVRRLQQAGSIEAVETRREGRRPERTVYRLTETGEARLLASLRELLAQPVPEPSQFMAALSFLGHLSPEDAGRQLEGRCARLAAELIQLDRVLEGLVPRLGRLLLVEVEYTRALRQAELAWLRGLVDDLRAGRLTWDPEVVRQVPAPFRKDTSEHGT